MSNFAILRTGKIKTRQKLGAASAHNSRDMDVPNAAPADAEGNHDIKLLAGSENALLAFDELRQKHGFNVRESADPKQSSVLAIEYMATMSPEMKGKVDIDQWAKANLDFFAERHGKENLLQVQLHLDEATPHIHFLAAPVVSKMRRGVQRAGLSAKDFVGGKAKLHKLQDDYAARMEQFGLTRGVKNSKVEHQKIGQFVNGLEVASDEVMDAMKHELDHIKMPLNPSKFATAWDGLVGMATKLWNACASLKTQNKLLKKEVDKGKKKVADLMDWIKSADINQLADTAARERQELIESYEAEVAQAVEEGIQATADAHKEGEQQITILNKRLERTNQEADKTVAEWKEYADALEETIAEKDSLLVDQDNEKDDQINLLKSEVQSLKNSNADLTEKNENYRQSNRTLQRQNAELAAKL